MEIDVYINNQNRFTTTNNYTWINPGNHFKKYVKIFKKLSC